MKGQSAEGVQRHLNFILKQKRSNPSAFSKKLLDWIFHHKNLSDFSATFCVYSPFSLGV